MDCNSAAGLLHKKHFRVPKGAITTTYTCTRCKDKSSVKAKAQDGKITNTKAKAQDRKITNGKAKAQDPVITHVKAKANNPVTRPKRRKLSSGKQLVVKPKRKKNVSQKSSKKGKRVILKHKKKRLGFENCEGKREPIDPGMHKRKRTTMHFSYWLNGLLFTGKPDDERVRKFREGKVLLPSQSMEVPDMQPLCCLCNEKYNSGAIYICCENCEGMRWLCFSILWLLLNYCLIVYILHFSFISFQMCICRLVSWRYLFTYT